MTVQMALDLPHRVARGRSDFMIADCNREAVAWLDRWPNWPGKTLILYGPAGCGKSHLCHVFMAAQGAVPVSADDLSSSDPLELAGLGPLILDDADSISDEAGLFHLFNAVREHGRGMLLTGKAPPNQWPIELADLASRLNGASAVAIGQASDELLGGVLIKLFRDRQLAVAPDVIGYLLKRMDRSFQAAGHLADRLDQAALRQHRRVTIALARDVLELPLEEC